MIKIEAITLEEAYRDAAKSLECSVTQLNVEVVQYPRSGIFGLFQKKAIIVAAKMVQNEPAAVQKTPQHEEQTPAPASTPIKQERFEKPKKEEQRSQFFNDTLMPQSFVSTQEEYEEHEDDEEEIAESVDIRTIASEVKRDINELFKSACFDLDEVGVSVYDDKTLLVEFKGADAALLIGKEGYRYKALSYMLFNWLNAKYNVQLRLEIAEFLKNQEEAVSRYLQSVAEGIERDGRAQTKVLDGVLVQIALKELRERYPHKYVAIRTTRDGGKYIIVNDYHA